MSGPGGSRWERVVVWLVAAAIGLQLLSRLLPRLLPGLVLLATVAGVLRLLWFYTSRH